MKWLAWCFCVVSSDSWLSRWWSDGLVVKGESGRQKFNKMTKCVNEWKIQMWSYKHTPTWLHDETTQAIQTHMINMTDRRCERQARHLWLIVDRSWRCLRDSECDSVYDCDKCFHSEHNKYTWSEDLEHDQNMVASMNLTLAFKHLGEINKQGGWKDSHELMEWTQVCEAIKWNSQGRLWNWLQAKILEGGCSRYNTWWHTRRTLASLFWFIDSIGPWSFGEYWIVVLVTSASPLTPWTYMVHLLPT